LIAVFGAGGGAEHSQRGPFAAAGAGAGAADVEMRFFFQHHVDEQVFADVSIVGGADVLEVAVGLARPGHHVFVLRNHFQGIVVAHRHAFRTTLALGRIDDDVEHTAVAEFLLVAS